MSRLIPLLIVDDREENLTALEAVLDGLPLELVRARSGSDALRQSLKWDLALILMDVQMPDMGGFEAAEWIRANPKTRHIPIIFISASMKDVTHQFQGYDAGAVDYILKPFEPPILRSKVRAFCELYRQRKDLEFHEKNLEALVEQRTAELKSSEVRYRTLFEQAGDGILYLSTRGEILAFNDSFARMHGYNGVSQMQSLNLEAIDANLPAQLMAVRMRRVLAGEQLCFEVEHFHRDGHLFPLEVTASLVRVGGDSYIVAFHRDITARKQAEQQQATVARQLQQAQRLESLGVLAGGLAHDFNNLLSVIQGHTSLLRCRLGEPSPHQGSLKQIEKASARAADLCRQMLAYAGKDSPVRECICLSSLVDDMANLLKASISKKADLILALEAGLPPVEADSSQMRQIIMNLIINASEAMGDGSGRIVVTTGQADLRGDEVSKSGIHGAVAEGRHVFLEVSDTGCGMDEATQQRIFDPFFTTKFSGRGLGMSAVLGIIRAHNGCLKLRSAPGEGTTFTILLPTRHEVPCSDAIDEESAPAAWAGRGVVLLVDDEDMVLSVGGELLEALGFTVMKARNGAEALEVFLSVPQKPDLVLLDMTMPRMNGAEAFREIRRHDPHARVVLSSGFTEEEVAARLLSEGLLGFVRKPYTLDTLRGSLMKLMGHALPRQASPSSGETQAGKEAASN